MDIASIGLELRSQGLRQGVQKLRELQSQGGKTERSVKGMGRAVEQTDTSMQRMSGTTDRLRNAIGALAGVMSVREVIRYSDAWNNAANQLRQVTNSTVELEQVQQALVDVARDTRSNFDATANLYARLARSTTELGLSQQDLLGLTTTINQSFAASGATADEASNAITQLSQGLASGALRGDEFNSVSEQAPGIMRAIAASLDLTIGELREFAATGGITAEIVVEALQDASDTIANDFGKTVATFGQDMEVARTNLVEWVGTSEEVQGAIEALGDTFIYLSENIDTIVVAAQAAAAIYAGRFVGSMAAASGAMARTTSAAAVLRGALAALGGPIGLLIGAGGLLYVFREELGFVQEKAGLTEQEISDLKDEMREMSNAQVGSTLSELSAQLDDMTLRAANAREELAKLREENRGSGVLGFEGGSVGAEVRGMQAVAEAQERIAELNDRINVARGEQASRIEQNANAFVVYADRLEEVNDANDNNATTTRAAAEASTEYGTALDQLRQRIQPGYSEAQLFAQGLNTINTALAAGKINLSEYATLFAQLQTEMQAGVLSSQTPDQAYGSIFNPTQGPQGATDPWQEWLSSAQNAFTNFDEMNAEVARNFTSNFGNMFADVIFQQSSFTDSFQSMMQGLARSVVAAIGEMIAQWLAYQAVTAALGFFGGGPVGGLFAGFFDKGGRIPSGQVGMVGEFGPELVRGPAQVTSRRETAQMMGGSTEVTVNVNNAPPGTQVNERTMDGKQIIDVFVADMSSNGRSAKALQSNFGLQRQGR